MLRIPRAATLAGLALLAGAGCSADNPPITTCEPADGIVPDCRFHNPEDLVPAPNGSEIIVSQFGGMAGEEAGSLVALRPADATIRQLFPGSAAAQSWGDADCPPGHTCEVREGECRSTGCVCEAESGTWACTPTTGPGPCPTSWCGWGSPSAASWWTGSWTVWIWW